MASKVPTPFSEPSYLLGLPSAIYTDSHLQWQKACRAFMEEHLLPNAIEWEKQGTLPDHVFEVFGKHGMLLPSLPAPLPAEWLSKIGVTEILGTKVVEWDYVHTLIYFDEIARCGLFGPGSSLITGFAFGIPPLYKFGNRAVQDKFLPDLLAGKKRCCIAITEPEAGSDVANVQTTATKTPDGKFYVINGTKKWITNGIWSDYATMAVRTGGDGAGGLSLVMVPLKNTQGVNMRRIKVSGHGSAGTTFIELDDVKVPVENLVGKEGMGMKYIMTNFNHERLTIAIEATRVARVALSTAFAYVMKREAFGQPLIEQPVVRHRLANAGALLETQQAWLEQFAFQMSRLPRQTADAELGGLTAMCKAQAGKVLDECARCAQLLFGGNGFTQSGQGELVEMITREVAGVRIPGGSEDVLMDLAIRQLLKNYQRKTKELSRGSKI